MSKKLTTEEFIAKAVEVHGDRYDYSKVEYINTKSKVEIICKEHGSFFQAPYNHIITKSGCTFCSNKRYDKDLLRGEFISKAVSIHGDKYDYSKVNYIDIYTKVEIICPVHGSFFQRPLSHNSGTFNGCPKCSFSCTTTEEFIAKAVEVHGDKYDYSKVEYVNTHTKVEIICPIHGNFFQRPSGHIGSRTHGCPTCSDLRHLDKEKLKEEFIAKAVEVHGDKYDYSKVEYVNTKSKVEIICKEHGSFFQRANGHIGKRTHGCPKCTTTFSSYEKAVYVLLESLSIDFLHQDRTILKPKELDFFIPSLNLAIEVNGGYWHGNVSNLLDDRTYHIKNKYMMLKDLNIDLINLYDNDFSTDINTKKLKLVEETALRISNRILLSSNCIPTELYHNSFPVINNDLGYSVLLRKHGYDLTDYNASSVVYSKNKLYVIGSGFSIVKEST